MTGVQDSYFKFHFITFKSDFPDSNTLRMVKLDQLISTVVHDELAEYDDLIISRVLSGEREARLFLLIGLQNFFWKIRVGG